MKLTKIIWALMVGVICLVTAPGLNAQSGRFTLGLYQGVRLSNNQIVKSDDPAADLTVTPRYRGYVAYAALEAKKLKEYATKPNLANVTPAAVEKFDELTFAPAPGTYYLIKSHDNRYYLCKLEKFENQGKAATYWKLTFSYEEMPLRAPETVLTPSPPNDAVSHSKKVYPDGSVYEGEFRNGTPQGQGIVRSADGSVYEGEFRNGKPEGKGFVRLANGTTYDGELANGNFQGRGNLKLPDGTSYEGDFMNGAFQGRGILRFSDGGYYEGEFWNGKCNGAGTVYDANGQILKKGQWRDNNFIGPAQSEMHTPLAAAQQDLALAETAAAPTGDCYTLSGERRYFDIATMTNPPSSREADIRLGSSGSAWYFGPCNGASMIDLGTVPFEQAKAPAFGYSSERVSVKQDHVYAVRAGDGSYGIIAVTDYSVNDGFVQFMARLAEPKERLNLYYLNGESIRFDLRTMNYAQSSQSTICFRYSRTVLNGENGALLQDLGNVDYETVLAPRAGYTPGDVRVVKDHVYAVKCGGDSYVLKVTNVIAESDMEFLARRALIEPANSPARQTNQSTASARQTDLENALHSPETNATAEQSGLPVIPPKNAPTNVPAVGPDKPVVKGEIQGGKYIYHGKVIFQIPGTLDWACISPNEKYVAYKDGREINYYDIAKKVQVSLYHLSTEEYMGKYVYNYGFTSPTNYDFVKWSDDSKFIVVRRWTKDMFKGGSGNYQITIVDKKMTSIN